MLVPPLEVDLNRASFSLHVCNFVDLVISKSDLLTRRIWIVNEKTMLVYDLPCQKREWNFALLTTEVMVILLARSDKGVNSHFGSLCKFAAVIQLCLIVEILRMPSLPLLRTQWFGKLWLMFVSTHYQLSLCRFSPRNCFQLQEFENCLFNRKVHSINRLVDEIASHLDIS